ncbi:MAG: hypothetical protein HY706_22460, partial [Candidatus Hydrogenedentes bacterium]|nr:hypothetical protein [Candidatus Hydrogenedentota bacterium]
GNTISAGTNIFIDSDGAVDIDSTIDSTNGGNIAIQANDDLTVDANITTGQSGTLRLTADKDADGSGNLEVGLNVTASIFARNGQITLEGEDITLGDGDSDGFIDTTDGTGSVKVIANRNQVGVLTGNFNLDGASSIMAGGSIDIDDPISATVGGAGLSAARHVTVEATTINVNAEIRATDGNLILLGTVNAGAALVAGINLAINGNVTLTADSSWSAEDGDIDLNGAVNATIVGLGAEDLTLNASNGTVFARALGTGTRLGALIVTADAAELAGDIQALSVDLLGVEQTTLVTGTVDIDTVGGTSIALGALAGNNLTISAGTVVTLNDANIASLDIDVATDVNFDGNLVTSGTVNLVASGEIDVDQDDASIAAGGNLTLNAATIDLNGEVAADRVTLTGPTAIRLSSTVTATTGDITINNDLTVDGDSTIQSMLGSVILGGNVDATPILLDQDGNRIAVSAFWNIDAAGRTITANGGPAGAGQPGTNGGTILLTTVNGDVVVDAILAQGSNADTGAGGNGGQVTITAGDAVTVSGSINTSGGNGAGNGAGGNGGEILIVADGFEVVVFFDPDDLTDPVDFVGNVDLAVGVDVSTLISNGGAGAGAGNGGNAADIVISSISGATVLRANIGALGGDGAQDGFGGDIIINNRVTLAGDITLDTRADTDGDGVIGDADAGANDDIANDGDIIFGSTVDASTGDRPTAPGLFLNTDLGRSSFVDGVGDIFALREVVVDIDEDSVLELGGNIVVSGDNGIDLPALNLISDVTLDTTQNDLTQNPEGAPITINQTVTGAFGLTAIASGSLTISAQIGEDNRPLVFVNLRTENTQPGQDIDIDIGANIIGGAVETNPDGQTNIGADQNNTGGTSTFNGTTVLDGAADDTLNVSSRDDLIFNDALTVTDVDSTANGTSSAIGSTNGSVIFNSAVLFNDNAEIQSDLGNIDSNADLNGVGQLTLRAVQGNVSLSTIGQAGADDPTGLTVVSGTASLNGNVTTNGLINFDAVGTTTFGASLTVDSTNSDIDFGGALAGPVDVTLDAGAAGNIDLNTGNIASLTLTDAASADFGGAFQTIGAVDVNITGVTNINAPLAAASLDIEAASTLQSSISTAGNIELGAAASEVQLTGIASLNSNSGNVTVLGDVTTDNAADREIIVTAPGGTVDFRGSIGGTAGANDSPHSVIISAAIVRFSNNNNPGGNETVNVGDADGGGRLLVISSNATFDLTADVNAANLSEVTFDGGLNVDGNRIIFTNNIPMTVTGLTDADVANGGSLVVIAGAGNVSFGASIGATTPLSRLFIASAGTTTLNGLVRTNGADGISLEFAANVSLGTDVILRTTVDANADVVLGANLDGAANLTIDSNDRVTINNIGSGIAVLGLTVISTGTVTLNAGTIQARNGADFSGASDVTLDGAVNINTSGGNGDIDFQGTAIAAGDFNLTLNAGAGDIRIQSIAAGGELTLTSANDIFLFGSVSADGAGGTLDFTTANRVVLEADTTITVLDNEDVAFPSLTGNFDLAVDTNNAGNVTFGPIGNVASIAIDEANNVTFNDVVSLTGDGAATALNIDPVGVIDINASISVTSGNVILAAADIDLGGNLTATGGNVTITGVAGIDLTNDVLINTSGGNGNVNFAAGSDIDADAANNESLTIDAGSSGDVTLQAVGATNPLESLTVTGGTVNINADINANLDIRITSLEAADIAIQNMTSTNGSIALTSDQAITNAASATLTAQNGTVDLQADTGIGAGSAILTNVAFLEANTDAGEIAITETSGVTLGLNGITTD